MTKDWWISINSRMNKHCIINMNEKNNNRILNNNEK